MVCQTKRLLAKSGPRPRRAGSFVIGTMLALLAVSQSYAAEVVWTFHAPAGYVDISPAIGDVDGDGVQDVIVASTAGSVFALGNDGFAKWRWDVRQPISVPASLADLTGDGKPDVLVLTNPGRLLCLDGSTGSPIWTYDMSGRLEWAATSIAATDVNKDGKVEVITSDSVSSLVCLNPAGSPIWRLEEKGGWRSSPAVGDLNGDGLLEVLMGSGRCPLVCVSHEGKELWRLPNDGAAGTSPVIWDLNADGTPEILTGVGAKLTAVSAGGKVLWQHPMSRDMDAAISVADADGDGRVEVFAVDLNGQVACVSGDGKLRWKGSVEQRCRRSPAIADVDSDGQYEIVIGGYSGAIHVFSPTGELEQRFALGGTMNATPTVVDLTGKGNDLVICPMSSGKVVAYRWPDKGKSPAQPRCLWCQYRHNSARTAAPTVRADKPRPTLADVGYGDAFVGTNTVAATVQNPQAREMHVTLQVLANGEPFATMAKTSSDRVIPVRLSYTLTGRRAVTLTFKCLVKDGDEVVLSREHVEYVEPFVRELALLDGTLTRLNQLLPKLPDPRGLRERVRFLHDELDRLRHRVQIAVTLSALERGKLRDKLAALRDETVPLLRLVERVIDSKAASGLIVSAANPWAPFGGVDEAGEGRLAPPAVTVEAFRGEVESAAVNVFNATGETKTLRVEVQPVQRENGKQTVAWRDVVTLREAVSVPTMTTERSADPLPRLSQGYTIAVPPWAARQLWMTVRTDKLKPGTWTTKARLRLLAFTPTELAVPLTIRIHDQSLPDHQPLRLCHWGYVSRSVLKDQPDAALADQLDHGTNVFVSVFSPKATFNDKGELVGEIDYAAHDAFVRRHAPHGIILFHSWPIKGPAKPFTPVWEKAAVAYIRAWVKHLADMGVGYDGFAFYPVDEPGLREGLVDLYIHYAKVARKADPKIQMYTDPVGGASMGDLKAMAPYVDIWCPNRRGYMMGVGADKLEFIKSTGETLWMYECEGSAKLQSPLAYYRAQAWLAWHHGLTGIGFWNYCVGPEPWYEKGEYTMIYPGDGVVTSKRWEAVRDGIEDYGMLWRLRQAADVAAKAGKHAETVARARKLLAEQAAVIAAYCGGDEDNTLPGVDGMPGQRVVADQRWKTIRQVRREIASLLGDLE